MGLKKSQIIKKDKQHDGQKKKNNDIHNTTHITEDRATRTPLKSGD